MRDCCTAQDRERLPTWSMACIATRVRRLALALLMVSPLAQPADLPAAIETDVKAAMLFNFAYFVQWSDTAPEPVVICVANDRGIRKAIEDLTVSRGQQKKVQALDKRAGGGAPGCDVYYVGGEDLAEQNAVLQATAGQRVLTVGEGRRFAERGGGIGFYIEQNRVRFAVNLDSLRAARIGLSSKVLSLAAIVKSKSSEGGAQ